MEHARSNTNFANMKNSTAEIEKLRAKAEASMNKTIQFQKALSKIEATILWKENQNVSKKSKNP